MSSFPEFHFETINTNFLHVMMMVGKAKYSIFHIYIKGNVTIQELRESFFISGYNASRKFWLTDKEAKAIIDFVSEVYEDLEFLTNQDHWSLDKNPTVCYFVKLFMDLNNKQ